MNTLGEWTIGGRCGPMRHTCARGAHAQVRASHLGPLNVIATVWLLMMGAVFTGCGGGATVDMGSAAPEAESVLFKAIGSGDLNTVRAELARDGSLLYQTQGSFAQTPLHKAVRSKQLEVARFLIESGAEVNTIDVYWRTPLSTAIDVEAGPEMIKLLEANGAID